MPFLVETMFPEWAVIRIGLIFTFTVKTLEGVGAWFALFCLWPGWVNFIIGFTILSKVTMIFSEMRTIILYTLSPLNMAYSCCVFPLPAVLVL